MKKQYRKAVKEEFLSYDNEDNEILSDVDIAHLPEIVQKYIRLSGFMGKEKIRNFRAEFSGGIRFKEKESFMAIRSVQYNFLKPLSRLFYIKAKKMGIPAMGLHLYRNAKAIFKIKILGIFKVVNAYGPEMDQGETVTLLNDMVMLAPGTLIDKRLNWEVLDELRVKATLKNADIQVSAEIQFDRDGRVVNFVSNDRFETDGKEYINSPWETPTSNFGEIDGYSLPYSAKLIYKRPEGEFCYGEFTLKEIEFNCDILK